MHTKFVCGVIEEYKKEKGMDGKTVIAFFKKNDVIGFLEKCYPALHTVSMDCIIDDIDSFARE